MAISDVERRARHAAVQRRSQARKQQREESAQFGVLRGLPAMPGGRDPAEPAPGGRESTSGGSRPSLAGSRQDRSGLLRQAVLAEIESVPDVEAGHPVLCSSMLALADRIDAGFHPATQVAAVKLLAGLTADLRTTPEAVRLIAVPEPTKVEQLIAMLSSPL